MIDFTLSDEHQLLEQSIREWGAREVLPFIHDNDRRHHFDRERILGGMAKLGLLGISVPQDFETFVRGPSSRTRRAWRSIRSGALLWFSRCPCSCRQT